VETLCELPNEAVAPLFLQVQRLERAVQRAMQADGTFVAINNRVSQSVPHLHVHIVPRRAKDGLRGFFWPRNPYPDTDAMNAAAQRIREALDTLP
jgi:histidine triad (HIT) family protein